jgi:transcriptional regulator with XRE-family HTH domain
MTGSVDVVEAIASTVRAIRTAHCMSVEGLAARAGIGSEVVIALEEGKGIPNLETLVQVADALMVPLVRLVEGEPEPVVRVFQPSRQPVLWHGPKGGTGTLIVGSDPRPSLEMWKWRLEPGEIRYGAPHPPGNREIAYVDEGALTLTIDGCRYVLQKGSAAIFVGDRPHSYANETDAPLQCTLTVADP